MNNNNFGSSVRKSLSLDELNIQVPDDIFVLTSTKNSGNNFSISKHNNGRKAILPTPNRPKNVQNLLINNNKEESSVIEQSVVSKDNRSNIHDDNKFHLAVSNVMNKFRVVNPNCHIENTLVSDESTRQNKSCDVDNIDNMLMNEIYKKTITDNPYVLTSSSHQITSTKDSIPFAINNNNPVRSTSQSAVFDSTRVIGEKSVDKSAIVLDNSSSSLFDQTLNDLRKAIVENLIKNPKVFKGGKGDVKKWIEEIEHLFEVAHIPDPIRLDLISYSLRDDAREWFRNNRSSFSSWNIFVDELKRAFTSSFIGELPFKKLESYSQGTNQSIRNYFNEVLKLCKEADDTMSESTKLKNLLNKTKPSIQLEIRKKNLRQQKSFFIMLRK
ncbi:unnamed protein product [Rotaria magnacalcarata]|uniref:Retrotransposon gag domain-containing protein n=2 Tax=Rotaria magnacalcarata TaxID=392030 RepID=A0A819P1I2_9BILA|nr:unnamed protein product [Rotaria magnacalcarata]CAF4005972.1 unnamed protein product [Rotaria magnacalcarata]